MRKRTFPTPGDKLHTAYDEEGKERFRWTEEISVAEWESAFQEHLTFEYPNEKVHALDVTGLIATGAHLLFENRQIERLEQLVTWAETQPLAQAYGVAQAFHGFGLTLALQGQPELARDRFLNAIEQQDWENLRAGDRREWIRNGARMLEDIAFGKNPPDSNPVPQWMVQFSLRLLELRWPNKTLPKSLKGKLSQADGLTLSDLLSRCY